jgi:error-prone DNA polymerase
LGEAADQDRPLFASIEDEECEAPLPGLTAYEEVLADYRTAGLSLGQHPIAFFREQLNAQQCLPAGQLAGCRTGRIVRVAGIIILRQRPSTARGIIFMTLEDETGIANLIVRPHIWQRFHRVAGRASAVIVQGQLQHQEEVIHVIAQQFTDLASLSRNIDSQSRDFH